MKRFNPVLEASPNNVEFSLKIDEEDGDVSLMAKTPSMDAPATILAVEQDGAVHVYADGAFWLRDVLDYEEVPRGYKLPRVVGPNEGDL